MSRMTDLQSFLKGLGKIGACSSRLTQRELNQIWDNSYIKPVTQQAIKIVLDSQQPAKLEKKKGISNSQALENLPLVLEGFQIYASVVAGLPFIAPRNQINFTAAKEKKSEVDIGGKRYILEIDRDVSALDLLDLDLTNEDVLRGKIFKKIEVEDVEVDTQVQLHSSDERTKNISEVEDLQINDHSELRKPQKLSSSAKERSVPSTRLSRVVSFASLGVGLGLGVVAEASRRAVGINKKSSSGAKLDGSLVLNEANAERIVATLCRVRGAALKMGQILSIQDGAVIGPELQRIFDRVRESADFMPEWQLEKVMRAELGTEWREKFREFQVQPFAAASIGQVHYAVLHDGSEVAVKVQYPGVAKSIDSDIRNLMSLITVMAILPEGLFIDNITKHMKIELGQECDYLREANCGDIMGRILSQYNEYYVPRVHQELCSTQVLTSEYITGLTIDNCVSLPQETRNFIAESILKLVFRELFLHRYMQTDPNWANFLYNPNTNKIGLLDFGATREYRPEFVNTYFKIIDCAAHQDREGVLKFSRELGFLTGYESQVMNDAHVDSVMLLAVPFHENKPYNFGQQRITHEIQDLSAVMLKERLCPPPPEVYSLHRKLSGLFLLAGKLDAQFNCYVIWQDIRSSFRTFDADSVEIS